LPRPFLEQVSGVEAALAERSLQARVAALSPAAGLRIVEYEDGLAGEFLRINEQWISSMFTIEASDREVLEQPRRTIVDRGGAILFVAAEGLGIVGTCALYPSAPGAFELTKMGVLEEARGRKAGSSCWRPRLSGRGD
jgi:hypothetical protein